jgi:serine/threonine-protein kinase
MPSPVTCPSCSASLAQGVRFCSACGHAITPSSALPTVNMPSFTSSRSGAAEARFLPGVVLAGRYRIIGLLGRGGMGEVYRADDLKLGQAVALKFLPPGFEQDGDRLQRFLDEVRTARQVSHANVCRIYDAGEADGHHFLSMEYVDGEDLGSLLRRIGHLPKDKAIQIARQLCAGLAASHEIGVLHRDLKPSNIMIDGRGRARITDFGLAGFAHTIAGAEIRSGTPAYMAPEQLTGREVTVRSDLYALGLVLYELFTGKPAFAGELLERRCKEDSTATPSTPSSLMDGFDPTVERVILRCLDPDPSRRPASALAVAAALPGGDPLAAALAAGETPSPEMVAEAGGRDAAPAWVSWGGLGVFAVGVVGCVLLASRTTLLGMVPLEKPPEALEDRAREILKQAGADTKPADSLFVFAADDGYVDSVLHRPPGGADRWSALRTTPPAAVLFWYRQSPAPIVPASTPTISSWLDDPADTSPGMARVGLDPEGRLMSLRVVPGEHLPETVATKEPDWTSLIQATGVDASTLQPAPPEWAPPSFAERRAAWTATWPGKPEIPVRIEAASVAGKPVSLRVVLPWMRPAESAPPAGGFWARASKLVDMVWFVIVLVVTAVVALRNVRAGRGDRRGALRFALYLGAVRMLWFLDAHHVAAVAERDLLIGHLSFSMQRVGLAYIFYLAIEPYARRIWPQMLVSWVRVLEGRFRDPLVARDLLLGAAGGALFALVTRLGQWIPELFGGVAATPLSDTWALEALRGGIPALVSVIGIHTQQMLEVAFPVGSLLIFRAILRNNLAAIIAVSILGVLLLYPVSGSPVPMFFVLFLRLLIFWNLLFRAGFLALAAAFTVNVWLELPLHPQGWYAGATVLALLAVSAPAVYGFWYSRGGKPLFGEAVS